MKKMIRMWTLAGALVACQIVAGASDDASGGLVSQIKVAPDKAPDCTTLKTIADTITRGCKNNDERAVAVYNFMNLTHYHRQYPNEPGGLSALKEINCYGWSLCGGLHSEESAIWEALGWNWRFVGWDGHTTVEAGYDGGWHYLDVFLKFYAWKPDGKGGRTIAGEDELSANPHTLITDAYELDKWRGCVYAKNNPFVISGNKANWRAPAFLSCGDTIEDTVIGLKSHRGADHAAGWNGIEHASGTYSAAVNLAPGFCLENTWDAKPDAWYWAGMNEAPQHTCSGHKDTRNDPAYGLILEPYINSKPARSYGNGALTFTLDPVNDTCLQSFAAVDNVKVADNALVPTDPGKPASVTLNLASPYILTQASGMAVGADTFEVSVDKGATFKPAELENFSSAVKGQTSVLVKVTFKQSLKALRIAAVVQNNPGALPYLSPGKNRVTVSVADPAALGENKLSVTYAYRLGSRSKSFEQLCNQDMEIAGQHNAKWSDTITYAQKTLSARQLPATFDIDCPTPKGQYPVYPRMLFLRREVLAPGATAQPLPTGAVEAQSAAPDELQALPNPFLIGSEMPMPIHRRAIRTTTIPLTYVQFVDEKSGVTNKGALRWPKNGGEDGKVLRSAVLVSGDLTNLPTKGMAAARLTVPVSAGHSKAAGKLGVALLKHSVEPGKAFDLMTLTNIIGNAIVPTQPGETPVYQPAKMVAIDISRSVKAIAAGEVKFNGFALRIVPDRGTDQGWTVRCEVSPTDKMWLEIDTYVE